MSTAKIRTATDRDAPVIQTLWNHAIEDTLITFNAAPKSLEDVERAIRAEDGFWIAEEAGQVLGYAAYGPFRTGIGYAHTKEHSIMLDPMARGRGIGRALMRAVEDHARAAGVHSLIAGISGSNPMGEPFHTALGFVKAGQLREAGQKFGSWHDLVLMQKLL